MDVTSEGQHTAKYKCIIILTLVVAVIVLLYYVAICERFASKGDKARAIYDWFTTHPSPTYTAYKTDMGGASNIVEYEDVLRLPQRDLTVEAVQQML